MHLNLKHKIIYNIMIKGVAKTEAMYRAVIMDSSSSLKDFSQDRKKYHKRYVLREKVEEKENAAANMGRMVETLLLEPHEFEGRFYLSVCTSPPTGLMLAFVESLYRNTVEAIDDMGEITRKFEDIAKDAYNDSGFKIKFEAVLGKFVGSEAETFYKEMREVKSKGLTVVTTRDIEYAERIVESLRTNSTTAKIVNLVDSSRYQVINQFQIEGYVIDGHEFKSMMDKIVIDHNELTIQVYDLKCTWSVENFYEEYYLYRRSYIQAYLYHRALFVSDKEVLGFDHSDYEILFPKFIVCDSTNYMDPLIYTLNDSDMDDAYHGFQHKGKFYPGVKSIIEGLKWAQENDIWSISRENYMSGGIVNIKGV